jgi:hypothetical protein
MDADQSVGTPAYAWNTSFPLLTNLFFLWDMGKLFFFTGLIVSLLLSIMLLATGNPSAIPPLMLLMAMLMGGFMVLTLLVCVIWFGNRFYALFAVNREGAMVEVARDRDKVANRLTVVLGILRGNMAAAGAGLLAVSEEAKRIAWADAKNVLYYPDARVISIKNSWRVVVRLYCTPENYDQVAEAVRRYSVGKA